MGGPPHCELQQIITEEAVAATSFLQTTRMLLVAHIKWEDCFESVLRPALAYFNHDVSLCCCL